MPYFEGDFWPNVIEESIKELAQEEEEEEKRRIEEAEAEAALDVVEEVAESVRILCCVLEPDCLWQHVTKRRRLSLVPCVRCVRVWSPGRSVDTVSFLAQILWVVCWIALFEQVTVS